MAYDGQVRITANDSSYAAGGIALSVSNQPVRWDDVQVLTGAAQPSPTVTRVSPEAGSTAGGT